MACFFGKAVLWRSQAKSFLDYSNRFVYVVSCDRKNGKGKTIEKRNGATRSKHFTIG